MKYTITVFTENKPGVLFRIADIFLRRKINIESLTVSEIETKGLSRFTIVLNLEEEAVHKVVKQLDKIVEVVSVYASLDAEIFFNEVALIKVSIKGPKDMAVIGNIVKNTNAKIAYADEEHLIIEQMGTETEVQALIEMLEPIGIKDLARSGRTAVLINKKISVAKE